MNLRPLAVYGILIATSGGLLAIPLLSEPGTEPQRPASRVIAPMDAESMVETARSTAGSAAPEAESAAVSTPILPKPDLIEQAGVELDDSNSPETTDEMAAEDSDESAAPPIIVEARDPETPDGKLTLLSVTVQRGDTLARILTDAGISKTSAQAVVESLHRVFNPKDLKPGHEVRLRFQPDGNLASVKKTGETHPLGKLQEVELLAAIDQEVAVRATPNNGFIAAIAPKSVDRLISRSNGEITGGSLLAAGMNAGVPVAVMTEMIRIFSYDVDFQRDVQPGDTFDLLYERFQLADGRLVRGGEVIYAALTIGGKPMQLYRHKDARGGIDYYDSKGQSVRKALLRTPIDGARLSSRFGMRDHPILGYTVMHRGVDFAAPTGTPIFAAGAGTIDMIGTQNGYGRYIRLRHTGSYATAYAHLSAFGRSLKKGMRVNQGQVIGYVGTSGRSTGPHLHYEVMRDGKQVNPMSVKFPGSEKLAGAELTRFLATRAAIDRSLVSPKSLDQLAASTAP
jgi:murein DD-endopeptidase MepM/ murein hydrolase activator NlpD